MSETIRVCHIISSFRPVIGGAERATENLCRELLSLNCDVIVLTRRYEPALSQLEEVKGIPVYRLGYPDRGKLGALSFALHALWLLATRFHPYRIIHVQNIDTPLLAGFLCKILLGRLLVATIHSASPVRRMNKTRLGRLRLQLMALLVDRFTAVSAEGREQLVTIGVLRSNTQVIPNSIDTNLFRPPSTMEKSEARSRLHLGENDLVVLYLGRLVPWKRVDLLLQAWARLPTDKQHQLVVVGTGPELSNLKRLAADLGISVRFDGPTDDAIRYLQAADIFVLPSGLHQTSEYEGLSVALLEAMSAGLAVIVTDCPGNRALVRHQESGLVFSVGDVDGLAAQLKTAMLSPELRQMLGQNAHESTQAYSMQAVARQSRALYEQVTGWL